MQIYKLIWYYQRRQVFGWLYVCFYSPSPHDPSSFFVNNPPIVQILSATKYGNGTKIHSSGNVQPISYLSPEWLDCYVLRPHLQTSAGCSSWSRSIHVYFILIMMVPSFVSLGLGIRRSPGAYIDFDTILLIVFDIPNLRSYSAQRTFDSSPRVCLSTYGRYLIHQSIWLPPLLQQITLLYHPKLNETIETLPKSSTSGINDLVNEKF